MKKPNGRILLDKQFRVANTGSIISSLTGMTQINDDLRHAWRALVRTPGFTIATVLTLGLGMGTVTAVVTLLNAIVLKPLSHPDADRLVVIRHTVPGLQPGQGGQSTASYDYYRRHSRAFAELGLYNDNVVNVTGVEIPERVEVAMTTASVFATLGARPVVGRLFTEDEGQSGREPVVLISHGLWVRKYNADPAIVTRSIGLNGRQRRVVGVLPTGFDFPRPETEVWYAAETDAGSHDVSDWFYQGVARLRAGVTLQDAEADLNRMLPGLAVEYPAVRALLDNGMRASVVPLKDVVVGPVRSALWLLLGGMGLVLVIAYANVANLLLVRAEHRQREVAVRIAMGARLFDLGRTFLSETMLLATAGGAAGLLIAFTLVRLLVQYGPHTIPRLHEVRLDPRVYAFALVLALVTGLAFALVPLFRRKLDLPTALKSGAHGSTADRERNRARGTLVVVQVALAMVLLIGSALLVQSFMRLSNAKPGFNPDRVLSIEISLPFGGYETYERNALFWQQLVTQVRELPGVESVGAATVLPLVPGGTFAVQAADRPSDSDAALPKADIGFITEGYLETMRMSLVRGEYPTRAGVAGAAEPVLVSEALAHRLFGTSDPIGQRLRRTGHRSWNVITGVIADVPRTSIGGDPLEALYLPVLDRPVDTGLFPSHLTLVVRSNGEPLALLPALRGIVRSLDPNLPLARVRTLDRIVADSMARTTLAMILFLLAGGASLLLGVSGMYAVLAYTVSRRTRELGIRAALGARAADLYGLVLRQAAHYVGIGVFAGVLVVVMTARLLRSLLYGTAPLDARTMAAVIALIFCAALAACLVPARRASRVEPMIAFKGE